MSFGLAKSGISVKSGIDLDPSCEFPYEANCRAKFIHQDVASVTSDQLSVLYGDATVRVLAGCAPCQPFSTYSQSRKTQDNRWELLNSFRDLAISLRPEIVTMENVERLALTPVWKCFVKSLEDSGYFTSWDFVKCDEIGVPQRRKRLVLLASLKPGLLVSEIPRRKNKRTVRQALSRLPKLEAGDVSELDPLHVASRLSELNLKRIRSSQPGGTWRDWDVSLRATCHQKRSGDTYPSVYGRMEWDEPSPTVTTQFFGYGNGRFGHPEQDRALTIREGAILQSFPPSYKFVANEDEISFRRLGMLIGNAVPPLLGKAIGQLILDHAGKDYGVSR